MEGEECITRMIDMADFEKKKTSKKQKQKMQRSVKGANISRIRRKPIRPKNAGFISPFDCLYSVAKKYDSYASENIHYMCISFILRSVEETAIKANSVVNVLTNHIFIKRKKRKNDNSKEKTSRDDLEDDLTYHLQCEERLPLCGLVLDPRQTMLKYSMGKQFSIKIFNFNSEDVLLPQNTNICKIFIYILKKDNIEGS